MALPGLWRRAQVSPADGNPQMRDSPKRNLRNGKAVTSSPSFRGGVRGSEAETSSGADWKKSNWKSAVGRVVVANNMNNGRGGDGNLFANVVEKIKVETSQQAARRLLQSARARTKKAVAAKGSRNVIFNSGYLYFLVLENDWWFTVCLSLGAYFFAIMMTWFISLPLELVDVDATDDMDEVSQAALALRFAAAHVITGSSSSILPVDDVGYFVSFLSMLLGVVVNVFVFAAVVAKFQSPQKDLVWSTKGVMSKRDDVPTLLIRVGNLRCHTLYNPTIRCTLLSRHVTKEGEGYMKKEVVEVMQPATVSGVHTIACPVQRKSPLFPILSTSRFLDCPVLGPGNGELDLGVGEDEGVNGGTAAERHSHDTDKRHTAGDTVMKTQETASSSDTESEDGSQYFQWLLHVTFTALDPIYGAELCSHTTYTDDSLVGPARFKDVIGVDQSGQPVIDWHAFDEHVDGCDHDDEDSDEEEQEGDDVYPQAVEAQQMIAHEAEAKHAAELEIVKLRAEVEKQQLLRELAELKLGKKETSFVCAPPIIQETSLRQVASSAAPSLSPEKPPSPVRSEISDDSAKEPIKRWLETPSVVETPTIVETPRTEQQASYRVETVTEPAALDVNSPSTDEFIFISTTCGPEEQNLPGPQGNPMPGCPRIAVLAARASKGLGEDIDGESVQGPLLTYCVYCVRLCLLFAEADVKFELVEIDRNCKQAWFRDAFPEFTTPAVQGTPGGYDGGEWIGDSNEIVQRAVEQSASVKNMAVIRGPLTLSRAAKLGETVKAALVCGRVLGTKHELGQNFVDDCLRKCELELDEDENVTRRAVIEVGARCVAEIESLLTSTEKPAGPFLGGTDPDASDAYLVPNLWVAHNLLESGVAGCFAKAFGGGAPCTFREIGGDSIVTYLENWSRRPSWSQTLRAKDTVRSASCLRPVVDSLVAAAPDTCDVDDMLLCMNRARQYDTYYQRGLQKFAHALPPVPPIRQRPQRTPGRTTTWCPENSEEVQIPGELGVIFKTIGGEGGEVEREREQAVAEMSGASIATTVEAPPIVEAPPPPAVEAPPPAAAPVEPADAPAPNPYPSSSNITKQESQKKVKKRKPTKSRTNATICI